MLLDFDDDPPVTLIRASKIRGSNFAGMPSINSQIPSPPVSEVILGRISSINSRQAQMWQTLGFDVDATFYSTDSSLVNSDCIVDDLGKQYRIVGRPRRIQKGNVPDHYAYPLKATDSI